MDYLHKGVAVAATAVEKQLKAILALHEIFSKKGHLDLSLLAKVKKAEPVLAESLNRDFIKFLGKGFMLRYASIDAADFGIVINQHRTLIELDKTIFNVDNGFQIKRNGEIQKTPLQKALEEKNPMVLEDNVPLAR